MRELEKTYLAKYLPKDLKKYPKVEILDFYIPKSSVHPKLRLRKIGQRYKLVKKIVIDKKDTSIQEEKVIPLTKNEYLALKKIPSKVIRKIRYYYPYKKSVKKLAKYRDRDKQLTAEIDIFLDDLKGLVAVEFEFKNKKQMRGFKMPEFCLADVTQEKLSAGGVLAGKKYSDLKELLKKYNYKPIKTV